jgi:uncharacterized Zn-binding protein involved in type VI secretion
MTRLGETTDHGGKALEAPPELSHIGIKVALDGHLVALSHARSGVFPIIATGNQDHPCTRVAYFGGRTACGAALMPASISSKAFPGISTDMKYRLLNIAATLLTPILAHAGCEDHFQAWVAQLHPGRTVDTDNAACKAWPANPALTVAALPLPKKGNNDDSGTDDLEVLVADSATGAVVAHTYQPSAITYDAVRLSGLAIDTARYQLTPGNRAFGVRIKYSGSSRVSPYEGTSLSLYVIDGQTLRPVLDRLEVDSSNGDWDGNCAGTFDAMSRSIEIGPAGKDGYAALKVSEKTTHSISTQTKSDCVSKDQPQVRAIFELEYRGGHYGVPKEMQLKAL